MTPMRTLMLLLALAGLSACGEESAPASSAPKALPEPVAMLPDAPAPTPFTRAHQLQESPDGTIRVFAQEDGDDTNLFEMVRQEDGSWSAPAMIDLPHVKRITSPAFDPRDGSLLYASDQPLESRPGRTDLNLWRAERRDSQWVEPRPFPEPVNTGAIEKSPAMTRDGTLYFATNRPDAGGGGLDIVSARQAPETEAWTVTAMRDGFNDARTDDHLAVTADGTRLFFYSHRAPKRGVVDIWTSVRGEDGIWSIPANPGAPLNTPGVDYGAGLSADGKTLFFSREGALYALPVEAVLSGLDGDGADGAG